MSLAIFVEGESDRASIPIILAKLGRKPDQCRKLKQGDIANPDIVGRHIKVLLSQHHDIKDVLILLDSECTDIEQTRNRVKGAEAELNKMGLGASVRYVIVDHSLECRPAELLRNMFRGNGKDFLKTRDNPKIATAIENPRVIAQRSPTFKYLLDVLGV